jgi:molecular chaperone GrpE
MTEGEFRPTVGDDPREQGLEEGETREGEAEKNLVDCVVTEEVLVGREEAVRQIDEWREKADDYLDKYRRSVAEFANYRKRQGRERAEQALRTSAEVVRKLLPAMDDFQRAIDNIPKELANTRWVEGILLIERKLGDILKGFQVVPIEALGKPFDPRFHSALMRCESDEHPPDTVVAELEKGYMIGDRVLRPTIVMVSTRAEREDQAKPGVEDQATG